MKSELPRILICAPKSGGGKTTFTCALLQALIDRGEAPVAFKCGPDYIDPMFHSEVIGAKSRNLDLFFFGEEKTRSLLYENAKDCGIAVIEGGMGYYDGISATTESGAWDLAVKTGTPALLVADGRGRALSVAAEIKGFCGFRSPSNIEGVVLNRVSPRLYPGLKERIESETGVNVYGYLPDLPECAIESRHLGLVTASEISGLRKKLRILASNAERCVDVDALLALAKSAPALEHKERRVCRIVSNEPVIAVARDKAFCFYYADALALLEELGGRLAYFSPLEDSALPENTRALYLGGGYPELYAERLSENKPLLRCIKEAAAGGMPSIAECGGFLYLHDTLEGENGGKYEMAGVIPGHAYKTGKLGRFGYVAMTADRAGLLFDKGDCFPAHEFHYWESEAPGADFTAKKPLSGRSWACAYSTETMYAGFPHLHLCAAPESAARFVAAAGRFGL